MVLYIFFLYSCLGYQDALIFLAEGLFYEAELINELVWYLINRFRWVLVFLLVEVFIHLPF